MLNLDLGRLAYYVFQVFLDDFFITVFFYTAVWLKYVVEFPLFCLFTARVSSEYDCHAYG